jgi:predicted GNAT family N-acyltransferase
MIIEILSFSYENKELFKKAIKIRFSVFTDEQGVDKDLEFDGLDPDAVHFLVNIDSEPAAVARWRETDEGVKIERMAVLKKFRHLGIGNLLLRYIVQDVLPSKRKIYLHAQTQVVNFYKLNHFETVGDVFYEANIPHYKMIYKKTI